MKSYLWDNVFFGNIIFLLTFLLPIVLICYRMPRRKLFALRASVVVIILLSILFCWPMIDKGIPGEKLILSSITMYSIIYLVITFGVFASIRCNIWMAIFCGTASYCMQHMTQRLYTILETLALTRTPVALNEFLYIGITGVVYALIYMFCIRKNFKVQTSIMLDNKMQIIVATLAIGIAIFVNSFSLKAAYKYNAIELLYFTYTFSIVCSFLALLVEFGLFSKNEIETELESVKRILYEEREQYIIEKENIDLINIKCHDLKHQVLSLKSKENTKEIEEISSAIGIYDSVIKTGNIALDVVLTKKSLYCFKNQIKLSCMIDGRKLNFIPEYELYSLFGNAIENAIESVLELSPEMRIITITEKSYGKFIGLRIENYFKGERIMRDGLPQTRKDKKYHGFGLKSMKMIIEKHGGRLYFGVDKDIFSLDIFLPIS